MMAFARATIGMVVGVCLVTACGEREASPPPRPPAAPPPAAKPAPPPPPSSDKLVEVAPQAGHRIVLIDATPDGKRAVFCEFVPVLPKTAAERTDRLVGWDGTQRDELGTHCDDEPNSDGSYAVAMATQRLLSWTMAGRHEYEGRAVTHENGAVMIREQSTGARWVLDANTKSIFGAGPWVVIGAGLYDLRGPRTMGRVPNNEAQIPNDIAQIFDDGAVLVRQGEKYVRLEPKPDPSLPSFSPAK